MDLSEVEAKSVLTRSGGFLKTVSSHSLQPYRGCSFGNALCGVGCYVRHNVYLTKGAAWGSFVEARSNAAEVYLKQYGREKAWAQKARGAFVVFMSSSTDPFLPQEERFGVTRRVLEAMLERPPDALILQSHTHRIARYMDLYAELAQKTRLRFHLSIESDRASLPGLPPPASPVDRRFAAAAALKAAGLFTAVTVAPLLPIEDPPAFFARVAAAADAVVLDHFIGGDGSKGGGRTHKTGLPAAMAAVDPASVGLDYRERMAAVARRFLPGRVGVSIDGFAGRYG